MHSSWILVLAGSLRVVLSLRFGDGLCWPLDQVQLELVFSAAKFNWTQKVEWW